ncbi:unnamed protein product, partial [Trichogramma brassicae]
MLMGKLCIWFNAHHQMHLGQVILIIKDKTMMHQMSKFITEDVSQVIQCFLEQCLYLLKSLKIMAIMFKIMRTINQVQWKPVKRSKILNCQLLKLKQRKDPDKIHFVIIILNQVQKHQFLIQIGHKLLLAIIDLQLVVELRLRSIYSMTPPFAMLREAIQSVLGEGNVQLEATGSNSGGGGSINIAGLSGSIPFVTIVGANVDNATSNPGQSTQARSNIGTHPTTSTQTRSTARPHVLHSHTHPFGHLAMDPSLEFDPMLSCNSHHVRRPNSNNSNSNSNSTSQTAQPTTSQAPPTRRFESRAFAHSARDNVRQRRASQMNQMQGGNIPFSDAYLNCLPSKRRKLIEQQKPQLLVPPTPPNSNNAIAASVERLVRDGITQTRVGEIEGAAKAVGSTSTARNAFGQAIKDCLNQTRFKTSDFPDAKRFPNATRFFGNDAKSETSKEKKVARSESS